MSTNAQDCPSSEILRIAVVSSPRSGNSWIRSTLAGALSMQEIAIHNYLDAPAVLPQRCFLQIHWYREPNFQAWLRANQFRVLTVARHPLDVLVSALHYIRYEPGTSRWLEGNVKLPGELANASPSSPEFLEYALGMGAEDLLSITYQWWNDPEVLRLRYEDAVANPEVVLGNQIAALGGSAQDVVPWLAHLSIDKMRATPNRHGWQGSPGLWRRLIVPQDAIRIYRRHRRIFDTLGYTIRPYFLTRASAYRNWMERL
ncbi:sulfotransferase domain-containing protein [Burkholderia ambifaria]